MTDPDKEARANVVMVRSGQKTLSQVIREQGMDPDAHLAEYAEDLKKLDEKGIWLDIDPRRVTQSGQGQAQPTPPAPAPEPPTPPEDPTTPDAEPPPPTEPA